MAHSFTFRPDQCDVNHIKIFISHSRKCSRYFNKEGFLFSPAVFVLLSPTHVHCPTFLFNLSKRPSVQQIILQVVVDFVLSSSV